MPVRLHPHLYEINTWPWLSALSRAAGRRITLGTVPDSEWSRLRDRGIDLVYLMGLWNRSRLGRELARSDSRMFGAYDLALPQWQARDVVGSAYCIAGYAPDPHLGTWQELDEVRRSLNARGMKLIVDFIPNHTGFDHPWVAEFPDRYVNGSEELFRIEPSAFRVVETLTDDVRFIACGRDPYFPPWNDVAQLNYFNPDARAAMVGELRTLANHADGARCDMAMLALNEVFARSWGTLTGNRSPPTEFWTDARAAVPGFTLIAEVYWDLEWRLQQLGFDFTYDKKLYDRLLHEPAAAVRAHMLADDDYQRRSARFIENHDEPRSAVAFGDCVEAAAVVMSTLQGMRFFYDGQFEGRRVHLPVQLGVEPDEPVDRALADFYERLLAIANDSVFHSGTWRLCEVRALDETSRHLVAWQWSDGDERRLVVVSLGPATSQGHVDVQSILPRGDRIVFDDLLNGNRYKWNRADLDERGLYVRIDRGQSHIFRIS